MTSEWKPEWDGEVTRVARRGWAMGSDSLLTARMIREPITSQDDIENAFDGITYTKGSAVLSMFEAYLGKEKFREGVRQYLRKHAHGNATTQDFLGALAAQGDARIPAAFSTFLDQAGLPLVSAELNPSPGGSTLHLTQRRFLPYGSKAPAAQTWQIPVTLRYATHGKVVQQRLLVDSATAELQLPVALKDLDFLLLNEGMTGYYRTIYRGDLLPRLLKDAKTLSVPERIGVIGDVNGAAQAGEIKKGEALALVPRFAADPNPHIASAMAGIAYSVREFLVPDEYRPHYARFIQLHFGERARALGFVPKPGEDENTKLLRQTLVGLVGEDGEDQGLRTQARELTLKWLEDRKSLDPNVVDLTLGLSARYGDKALFERFLAAAKATRDQREVERLLSALGAFTEPSLQQVALAELLTDHFDPRTAINLLWSGLGNRAAWQLLYDFMKQNFDAIMAKQPKETGANMPFMGSAFSDAAHRADVEAFFKDRIAQYPGGPRILAQVLEGISIREAEKHAQQPSVAAFLANY